MGANKKTVFISIGIAAACFLIWLLAVPAAPVTDGQGFTHSFGGPFAWVAFKMAENHGSLLFLQALSGGATGWAIYPLPFLTDLFLLFILSFLAVALVRAGIARRKGED